MKDKVLDLDAPLSPGAMPYLGLSDVLKYSAVIEQLVSDIEKALASGGNFTPPPLKFKTGGLNVEIDSVIKVTR